MLRKMTLLSFQSLKFCEKTNYSKSRSRLLRGATLTNSQNAYMWILTSRSSDPFCIEFTMIEWWYTWCLSTNLPNQASARSCNFLTSMKTWRRKSLRSTCRKFATKLRSKRKLWIGSIFRVQKKNSTRPSLMRSSARYSLSAAPLSRARRGSWTTSTSWSTSFLWVSSLSKTSEWKLKSGKIKKERHRVLSKGCSIKTFRKVKETTSAKNGKTCAATNLSWIYQRHLSIDGVSKAGLARKESTTKSTCWGLCSKYWLGSLLAVLSLTSPLRLKSCGFCLTWYTLQWFTGSDLCQYWLASSLSTLSNSCWIGIQKKKMTW